MNLRPSSLLSALLVGSLAQAQQQGDGPERVRRAASCPAQGADLRKDIEYLAGPETEGRGAGSPGDQKAIDHIARRMRDLGLEAPRCASCEGYLQTFVVEEHRSRPLAKESFLTLVHDGVEVKVEIGSDALSYSRAGEGRVTGRVVFVGYGLVIPELGRDDYAGLDVKGKVVLVLRGMPKGAATDARLQEHRAAGSTASKFAAAERAGAAAILVCRVEEAPEPSVAREDLVAFTLPTAGVPAFALKPAVSQELFTRCGESLAEHQRGLDAGQPPKPGALPDVEARLELKFGPRPPQRRTANVIGILPGRDPKLTSEFVLVGAHHDHLGRGEFGSLGGRAAIGQVHPGADDNASGVAALLEAAGMLRGGGGVARPVVFVAFGAGEAGMMQGSRAFLESGPVPKEQIVAMLNLDMVGRLSQKPLKIEAVGSGSGFADLFGRVTRRCGIEPVLRDDVSRRPERSDHYSFLRARIPAVWLTTGVHEQYRRPTDIAALIDFPGVGKVAAVVREAVTELAGRPARPEFVSEFGSRR